MIWVWVIAFFASSVGWVLTTWLLARRSFALVDIARSPHLPGPMLAAMAHKALGDTGARAFQDEVSK